MEDELKDYKERHIRWQNFAITQLGYTNNIITTLGIGFLAFAFDKEFISTFSLSSYSVFSCKMLIYLLTILFILISLGFGILTSISRLYDFKISRHVAITRQRFFDKCKNEPKPLPESDFPNAKCKELTRALCKILFRDLEFLTKEETKELWKESSLMDRFNGLRRLADTLGVLSWCSMKLQFLFLLLSLIGYSINLLL